MFENIELINFLCAVIIKPLVVFIFLLLIKAGPAKSPARCSWLLTSSLLLFIVLFVLQAHLPKVVLPFMPAAKVSIVMLWHQPWPIYFSLYFIPMFTLVFLWLGDLYQARRVVKKSKFNQ